MNRLQEIEARKAAIGALLESDAKDLKLDELDAELRALKEEAAEIRREQEEKERRQSMAAGIQAGVVTATTIETTETKGETAAAEQRGKVLKEGRSVTVASSSIVLPAHQAKDIKPTFGEVSSLLDRVNVMPLTGGESFTQPYLVGYGTGDHVTEGNDYATAEPTFGYAQISKAKVTAYAEDTEEVQKLPAANYDALVMRGIRIAARKKITREILVGTGATNRLTGIFDDGATAIDAATDLTRTEIDEDTLDQILYSFGGDEEVEDAAVLILNKIDLKAFAMLRTAEGRKIHEVRSNGNTGTIDGIPFIINSACKAISRSTDLAGSYCMAYGPLSNYTLAVFSDLDVQRSTDYRFKQGMIAHRGSIFVGGNVVSRNGFLRVKK